MGISEQSTLLCEQKLLTSRQIFRYAVPARPVTKKHWLLANLYAVKHLACKNYLQQPPQRCSWGRPQKICQ